MNLRTLSSSIDPVILDRGRDYVLFGYVRSIDKKDDCVYQAKVQGSELYEVIVELDDDGEVLSTECDCPYDFGPICKHQAAVLLKLREEQRSHSKNVEASISPTSSTHPEGLESLLEAASKESLIVLLLALADESDIAEKRIRLYLSDVGGQEGMEECRSLIRSYIDMYADDHGFVNWRAIDRAVEGAERVVEKALEAADEGKPVQAAAINLCVMEEMVDLLQSTDDSSGTIGVIIDESLDRLEEIARSHRQMSPVERKTLLHLLLKAAGHSRFEGWSDWQADLLQCASNLSVTDELREVWEEAASRICAGTNEVAWSGNYLAERVNVMRYEQLQVNEGEEQAGQFLNDHLHYPDLRKRAIQLAIDSGRFNDAIHLAEQGEAQDQTKGLPGLVNQWKRSRYEAYRLSGQVEQQRQLGLGLILQGDFSYYLPVKTAYPPADWQPIYRHMLEQLEKDRRQQSIYTRILVEERETTRLLAYVRNHPSEIEIFYPHLAESHREEIISIFQGHIEWKASHASTRKHYQDVCRVIRMLEKVGGPEQVYRMVRLLSAQYPNKPAFRDELTNL